MAHNTLSLSDSEQILIEAGLPVVCSLREAAAALGLSGATIRRRVNSGELHCIKTRAQRGGKLRLLRRDVALLLSRMSE